MEEERRLLRILKNLSYEEGDFLLASGKRSTFYIDCKETTLNPEGMYLVGHLMYQRVLQVPGIEAVGGVSIGGDPLVCSTVIASYALRAPIPGFFIRKEPKGHGTNVWIEGEKEPQKRHECAHPRRCGHDRRLFPEGNRGDGTGRLACQGRHRPAR